MTDTESVILDVIDAYPSGVDHGTLVRRVRAQCKKDITAVNIAVGRLVADEKLQKASDGKYSRYQRAVSPDVQDEAVRGKMLQELQDGPKSVPELAGKLGVVPNTINYHLRSLQAEGTVVDAGMTDRDGPGRQAALYGLRPARYTPAPAAEPTEPPPLRMKHLAKEKPCKTPATAPEPVPEAVQVLAPALAEEAAPAEEQLADTDPWPVPPVEEETDQTIGLLPMQEHLDNCRRNIGSVSTVAEITKRHARHPLGVMPLKLYEEMANEARIKDLLRAMRHQAEGQLPVDLEWVAELQARLTRMPRLQLDL